MVVREATPAVAPARALQDLVDAQWMLPGPALPAGAAWKHGWPKRACRRPRWRWR
jgi:hypothetical protein